MRALNGRERGDAVAQPRRALELERLEAAAISSREKVAHGAALAGQKTRASRDESGIVGIADFAGAGRGAALDLVEQARARAIVVKAI